MRARVYLCVGMQKKPDKITPYYNFSCEMFYFQLPTKAIIIIQRESADFNDRSKFRKFIYFFSFAK